jgi:hypothetical protein
MLAKVLLLEHRTGVSDEQAMECVAWDLRWKVALGLPVDHQGWHPTSLTKFRARLLLHKKEGLALENTLRLAEELGMLDGSAEQIIDLSRTGFDGDCFSWFLLVGGGQILGSDRPAGSSRRPVAVARS